MAAVVDVDCPRAGELLLLFPARLVAAVSHRIPRIFEDGVGLSRLDRLCGAGCLRLRLRPSLGLVDAVRAVRGLVPPVDDGREPIARGRGDLRAGVRSWCAQHRYPALPGGSGDGGAVDEPL